MLHAVARALQKFHGLTRLWFWLYLGRLSLALIATLPVLAVVSSDLDRSIFGQLLAGTWSLDILTELVLAHPGMVTYFVFLLIFLGAAALIVKQFLNGGIYHSLVAGRTLPSQEFFTQCARDFDPHLRVTLVMLPLYAGLGLLASFATRICPPDLFGPQGTGGMLSLGVREAILWTILILGSIFSDFMRLSLTLTPSRPVAAYWRTAMSLSRRIGVQSIGAYAAFYLPFVIFWILIEIIAVQVTGALPNGLGVILELILFQLCSFARSGQSLLGTAALTALVQTGHTSPPLEPVEVV